MMQMLLVSQNGYKWEMGVGEAYLLNEQLQILLIDTIIGKAVSQILYDTQCVSIRSNYTVSRSQI